MGHLNCGGYSTVNLTRSREVVTPILSYRHLRRRRPLLRRPLLRRRALVKCRKEPHLLPQLELLSYNVISLIFGNNSTIRPKQSIFYVCRLNPLSNLKVLLVGLR